MARQVNYVFCRYRIDIGFETLDEAGERALLTDNQGSEFAHGSVRDGVQPQTLCTDPHKLEMGDVIAHSFEVGYIPGRRRLSRYDAATKIKTVSLEKDNHTRFGHVVTVPHLGAMAIRDRSSDDHIGAHDTIRALRSFINGISSGDGYFSVEHATQREFNHAFEAWEVYEYSYSARPLNPSGGDLSWLRTDAYNKENVGQERGKVKAKEGMSLAVNGGIIAETMDLVNDGYGQNGLRGITEDGRQASITKPPFFTNKNKNLRAREMSPRLMRIAFEGDRQEKDMGLEVAGELVRFFKL